jgi:hypothetical protein
MKKPYIETVHPVDENHQVLTVVGGQGVFRKTPCEGCPWKTENDGLFPADAFKVSANTAYDMATHTFGCHESGQKSPATCAGFLLKGADHNLKVRMDYCQGKYTRGCVTDGGHDLHNNYREMAEANGVDPDDPILKPCR